MISGKIQAQRSVAEMIESALWTWENEGYGEAPRIFMSPDGEMSFQHAGRQIIVKIAAAR